MQLLTPYHQQRGIGGLPGGKKQVEPIWREFINNREELLFESEQILAERQNQTIETKFSEILYDLRNLKGETKIREVKTRVNQNAFRQIVMANYTGKCAITGIDIPDLLFASHIIPWSKNESERLNPENGICLSALYDKAFDKGYIGISEKYELLLSNELKTRRKKDFYPNTLLIWKEPKFNFRKSISRRKSFFNFTTRQFSRGDIPTADLLKPSTWQVILR